MLVNKLLTVCLLLGSGHSEFITAFLLKKLLPDAVRHKWMRQNTFAEVEENYKVNGYFFKGVSLSYYT